MPLFATVHPLQGYGSDFVKQQTANKRFELDRSNRYALCPVAQAQRWGQQE